MSKKVLKISFTFKVYHLCWVVTKTSVVESVDNLLYDIFVFEKYTQPKIERIKIFSQKYKIYIMPVVLLGGFLIDFITLRRVDGVFDNIILLSHLLIAGVSIVLLFSKDNRFGNKFNISKHAQKIEYVMLFSFGALFSGSIIFFSKSASLASSWPFFLLLLILMLGTEFQKKYFQRLIFQINFYYIALFSYLIVFVPVLTRDMGPEVFIVSGVSSLVLFSLFFLLLFAIDKNKLKMYLRKMIVGVVSIFLFFNFLYFANIIPPIPLSLKFGEVYHSVYRVSSGDYVGIYETVPFLKFWEKRSSVVHRKLDGSVYVFSAVFAPTRLNTDVYHQWQYFDVVLNKWVNSSRIKISISGGREGGFRGFSFKRSLHNGKWRVLIQTERGQNLGRIKFEIASDLAGIVLKEELL